MWREKQGQRAREEGGEGQADRHPGALLVGAAWLALEKEGKPMWPRCPWDNTSWSRGWREEQKADHSGRPGSPERHTGTCLP